MQAISISTLLAEAEVSAQLPIPVKLGPSRTRLVWVENYAPQALAQDWRNQAVQQRDPAMRGAPPSGSSSY
jgi:hypothetical protein